MYFDVQSEGTFDGFAIELGVVEKVLVIGSVLAIHRQSEFTLEGS